MLITSLHLHNFRSHEDAQFLFDSNVTAIIGPNGSGKTNILEAIYTLCMGKSFRDSDDDMITYEQEWYRIEGVVDSVNRELRYQPSNKGKQLLVDGATKGRFTYRQQLPVVLFEPDDLLMVHGSPASRRKYLDDLLSRLSLPYRQLLHRYERVLTQRNNLLKQKQPTTQLKDNLFAWDVSLAELGSKMIAHRLELIEHINERASDIYSDVATKNQQLTLQYIYPHTQTTETQIVHALADHLDDDMRRGFTSVGPHRHDMGMELNTQPAKTTASRGEVRSIVLSLKIIELKLIEQHTGVKPLYLLDDVFSELDIQRRQAMLRHDIPQTILTTTEVIPSEVTHRIELTV